MRKLLLLVLVLQALMVPVMGDNITVYKWHDKDHHPLVSLNIC